MHVPNPEFTCEVCKYRAKSQENLEIHMKLKHAIYPEFQCDSCSFKTNTQANLNKHIKGKHTDLFEFHCNQCSFQTNKQEDLASHKQSEHEARVISCEKCDFVSRSVYQHRKHIEVRHANNAKCWFWCNSVCRKDSCTFEHPPLEKSKPHKSQ